MRRMFTVIALAPALLAVGAGPAAAATENPMTAVNHAVSDIWDFITSPFEGTSVEPATPPSPVRMIHGVEVSEGSEFWLHLKDAGYEVKEITTGVGIIPDIKFSYQLMRELSDADRDWLERRLEVDALKDRGLVARIQRQIIRTLLAASSLQSMRITKVDITILPLPGAEFVMEPKEAPLNEEHDQIYRAILALSKDKLKPTGKPNPAAPSRPAD